MKTRARSWTAPPLWVWLSLLPFVLWPFYCLSRGELRWEQLLVMLLAPSLALGTTAMRKLYTGLYPAGVVGLSYEAMRFIKLLGVREDRVHLCDLRDIEVSLFGIQTGGVKTTLHDILQAHTSLGLDLLCAFPYATYIFVALGCAVYLYRKDFIAFQRFTWTFMVVNLAGFITYHVYPAAPPWYYHAHGCAVDLQAAPSPGPNLLRVDEYLGVTYFRGLYGRSNDVFGAVPSLHVSYPLIILLEGYRYFSKPLRAAAIAFFVTMCFAAVYLDHHWVIDVALGLVYTLAANAVVRVGFRKLSPSLAPAQTAAVTVPAPIESREILAPISQQG